MSEKSWPWTCTNVGDGAPFSVEMIELTNMFLGNRQPKESGVVYWTDDTVFPGHVFPSDGLLAPVEDPGHPIVRVGSGVALVKGWVYVNSENPASPSMYTFDDGNANAVDIIGLRLDVASQTVRLFRGRGGVSATYNLVQTSAIWEIPLAEITLDGSGVLSTVTDVRKYCANPTGSRVLLYETKDSGFDAVDLHTEPFTKLEVLYSSTQSGGSGTSGVTLTFNGVVTNTYYDQAAVASPGINYITPAPVSGRTFNIIFEIIKQHPSYVITRFKATASISTGFDTEVQETWQWNRGGVPLTRLTLTQTGSVGQISETMQVWGIR